MAKKPGMSFEQYSISLNEHLPSSMYLDAEARDALNVTLSLIAMAMKGQASFSDSQIRVANHGVVSHPRDADEAALALALGKTDYDVYSFRSFVRNFSPDGKIIHHSANYPEFKNNAYHLRFVQSWLGDKNGQPEEKVERLSSIMHANQNMQKMVRENFKAIDKRSAAMERLSRDEWTLRKMPIDVATFELATTDRPRSTIENKGEGCLNVADLALILTLDGNATALFRVGGRVRWEDRLDNMNPMAAALLMMLPDKLEKANKNFGRIKLFGLL